MSLCLCVSVVNLFLETAAEKYLSLHSPQPSPGLACFGFVLLEPLAMAIGAASVGAGEPVANHAGVDELLVGQMDIGGNRRVLAEGTSIIAQDE